MYNQKNINLIESLFLNLILCILVAISIFINVLFYLKGKLNIVIFKKLSILVLFIFINSCVMSANVDLLALTGDIPNELYGGWEIAGTGIEKLHFNENRSFTKTYLNYIMIDDGIYCPNTDDSLYLWYTDKLNNDTMWIKVYYCVLSVDSLNFDNVLYLKLQP